MKSSVIKDKIENGEYVEDYLPVYEDLPVGQTWQIVNYIDYVKPVVQAFEELAMMTYISHCEEDLLKEIRKNPVIFSEQYTSFKSINEKYLNKLFTEMYGDDYDRHRIWCSYGSYPSELAANRVVKELAKGKSEKYGAFVVIPNGYYVPFNPSPEMCSNYESTNDIMNQYMKGQLDNKKERKAIEEERKRALMAKSAKDAEARGTKLTTRNGEIEKVDNLESKFARFNPSNLVGLKINNEVSKQKLEAIEIMRDEMKLGNYARLNIDAMERLGFSQEEIEKVKSAKEKLIENKPTEEKLIEE